MADLTKVVAKSYNQLRKLRGQSNVLTFYRRQTTGYDELPSIDSDWYAEYKADFATGERHLIIHVARKDVMGLIDKLLTQVGFDGMIYDVTPGPPPTGEPWIWVLTVQGTGQIEAAL